VRRGKCSLKLRYGRDAVIERLSFGHAERAAGHHLEDDGSAEYKQAPEDICKEQNKAIWLPQNGVA